MTFEREFLIRLGATWLACRLAVMGGTPGLKQHHPVTDFHSLGWAMLGVVDYSHKMRLCAQEALGCAGSVSPAPDCHDTLDKASMTR